MGKEANIILIGMPGAGKSTLGVVLAKILGFSFLDADLVIQSHMGQTLQRTIDARGTRGFLDVEERILCGIDATRTVIATGGSAVYSQAAMDHFAQIGTIVYLEIAFEELLERIGDFDERGVVFADGLALHDSAEAHGLLAALYEQRTPLYRAHADITVDVSGLSIRQAALKVADVLPGSFTAALR